MDESYDDMIDDYINDQLDEENIPDHDFNNEYDEEEGYHVGEDGWVHNDDSRNNDTPIYPQSRASAEEEEENDEPRDVSYNPNPYERPVRENIEQPKKVDLYNFERYNKNTAWREDEKSSWNDGMHAKEWKQQSTIIKSKDRKSRLLVQAILNSTKNTKARTIASDSQLLKYQPSIPRDFVFPVSKAVSNPIPGKICLPLTLVDGTRIYVPKIESIDSQQLVDETVNNHNSASNHFLGVSMEVLVNRVNGIRRRKEFERNTSAATTHNDGIEKDATSEKSSTIGSPTSVMMTTPATTEPTNTKAAKLLSKKRRSYASNRLWVDKHAPTSFAHLLSDERSNREVVRALRAWDPYVFNREPPPPRSYEQQYNNIPKDPNKTYNDGKNRFEKSNKPVNNRNDRRPDESSRVILLSGPPGVGKTTLAHVVAHHCGYRPLEVNGSDERNESSLLDRVIRGMESTTLDCMLTTSSNGENDIIRPNCLILDEIDGVDAKSTIQALVDIIRSDIPLKSSKAKKGSAPYLRRPIILICNNKYAPALKPLLPFCKHQFTVYPPQPMRLVARLRAILTEENFTIQNGGSLLLNQLVTLTGGDIRSCLYTLQFAAAASSDTSALSSSIKRDISQALLNALQGTGLKDERQDVSGIIISTFRKDKEKNKYSSTLSYSTTQLQKDTRTSCDRVLDAAKSFGEYSKILDCLFLNVMNVSYIDPTMDRCSAVHEWLSTADVGRSNKSSAIDYEIEAEQVAACTAATHLFCRVEHQRQQELVFTNREMADVKYQTEAKQAILHKFIDGLSPKSTGVGRRRNVIATETTPYTLWILSAGVGSNSLSRPVASIELLSNGEKESFFTHAAVLHSLGLTYAVDREHEESRNDTRSSNAWNRSGIRMKLEPPIDDLIRYTKFNSANELKRPEIPTVIKELLMRRVLHERLRGETKGKDITKTTNNKKSVSSQLAKLATKETNKSHSGTGNDENDNDKGNVIEEQNVVAEAGKKEATDAAKSGKTPSATMNATANTGAKRKTVAAAAPENFLLIGAKRAKIAKSLRMASRCGGGSSTTTACSSMKTSPSSTIILSNTGSGVPISNVIKLKFVKGFTQAVRTPCQIEDLI